MQYLKQILTGKPQPDDNDDNVSKCGTEFEVSESFYIYIYIRIYLYMFFCLLDSPSFCVFFGVCLPFVWFLIICYSFSRVVAFTRNECVAFCKALPAPSFACSCDMPSCLCCS